MSDETIRASAQIVNKRGLHARASAKFVSLAAKYPCEVTVTRDGNSVSARSIMGLMMLGASVGTTIDLSAEGPQAAEAVAALCALIADKFQEDE
jgi:phosphocarrier protein HPr